MGQVRHDGSFVVLLPADETKAVRLSVDLDGDGTPDGAADSVAPASSGIRIEVSK